MPVGAKHIDSAKVGDDQLPPFLRKQTAPQNNDGGTLPPFLQSKAAQTQPVEFKNTVDFSNTLGMLSHPDPNPNSVGEQATRDANDRIANEIQNSDKAIGNLLTKQKVAEFRQKMDQFRRNDAKGPAPTPDFNFTTGARDQQAATLKSTLYQDPEFARKVLEEQGNVHPEKKGQIQADIYQLDRGVTSPKIAENVERIKKQELEYNPHTKALQKPEGFWSSLGTAYNERIKSRNDYDFFQSATPQQSIDKLETEYKSYDPDEPANTARGIGHMGKMIGGQPPQALLAAAGVSMVPGAEEAAPWAAALVASPEIHAVSYANGLKSHYNEFRDQGMDPEMAFAHAQKAADFNANVDLAQGALMTAAGTKLGLSPMKEGLSEGFLSAVKKGTQQALKGAAKEAIPQGFLAAGFQGVKNLNDGKPLGEGMTEAAVQTAATIAALGLIIKAPEVLAKTPKLYNQIKQGLSKNPAVTNVEIAHMVSEGNITPEQANKVSEIIQQHTELDNQIPAHIEDENTRLQIQDLIKHKTKLEYDLDTLNKAYHPAIKSKIADIDEQIQKLSDLPVKEKAEGAAPKPKATQGEKKLVAMPEEINSPIELSTKTENNETQEADQTGGQAEILNTPTGTAPQEPVPVLEQATTLLNKRIEEGKTSDVYKDMADHPQHLIDFINDQIKGGHEKALREDFGDDLVDLTKKQPITTKTEDNAIPIGQPEALGTHGNGPESAGGQSEGSGMGSSVEGAPPTGEGNAQEGGQGARQEEVNPDELPFTGRTSETVGISHGSVERRATESPVLPPERGQGVTVAEAVQHGRDLLAKGGDPEMAAADFHNDKKISYDALSLVRAKHAELARETNKAADEFGENSPQAKAAGKKESDWYKDVVKPMQTEWSKIGQTQQGETDIDTGTVTGLRRAYQEQTGKDFTPEQAAKAKELATQVKELSKKVGELEKKISEAHDKESSNEPEAKTIKEKAKKAADWIRKGKSSPPGSFSAATPASLVWDGMVEAAAKIVEAGGSVAEAIESGVKHLKDSDWYKGLSKEKQEKATQEFEDHINGNNPDLAQRFANKKGNKFSPQDAKDIWEYAKKEYLDKGSSYVDTINNVSKDLGLTPEQVRNAITQPKGTRIISDAIYIQQAKRTDAMNEAKRWVKDNDKPWYAKLAKGLPNFFFAAKVFGHGTVGMITHAGTNIFRPSAWKVYWPNFIRQFKYAFGGTTKQGLANYNKAMEDLKNAPDFVFWKRAGLAVDPKEKYDDYQGIGKVFGKIGAIGDRGFNALKVYRIEMARHFYDRLSNVEKADPETAKEIAKIVNHSSGTSEVKVPGWTSTAFFAPKLEVARWQGLITDPAKAAKTFTKWGKATPAEKVQAKIVAKKAGEIMATYMAGLAANSALLSLTGSKQQINFTSPTANDWLKFKAGDKTIDATGGMEATMRFISTLLHTGYLAYEGSPKELREKPQEKDYKVIGQQLRYKLSPFMSTVMDLATGTDAMGRPLPGSNVKPKAGVEPYTIKSYIAEQQLPIPITEGIRGTIESMKERGMDEVQIKDVLTGMLIGSISGGTGAKVAPDYSLGKQTDDQKKTASKLAKWKEELKVPDKKFLPTDIQYDHSTPKPDEGQTAELNDMVKAARQKLFETVQTDLDWDKMSDAEKKTALETVMKEGEETGKEAFKTKYPQFTPKRPEMTDGEREKQQEQSEKERDIQRKIANKARELSKP